MPSPPPSGRILPSPALRDRVASFQILEGDAPETVVMPGASVVLGLQWRGRVRGESGLLAPAGVTGLLEGARRYAYIGGAATVLVRFTPTGAACLGVPVSELSGRSVPLDDLLPATRVAELRERLEEAPDVRARLLAVEALLGSLPAVADPLVQRALALLDAHRRWDGPLVRRLTDALPTSERQLERRFERVVGLTPKRYAALRRFERALAALPAADSLGALAMDAGYYDQAHLNRDFRRFAGAPPGQLRRAS